jgi:GNAT superfamily N-acetyltransferase
MIRPATLNDGDAIVSLLEQLGYRGTSDFIFEKMVTLLHHQDALLLVYEKNGKVVALLSLHVIPQIALEGDFLRISYFVVDESTRNQTIGAECEAYARQFAQEKECDRIEVHCHERRKNAHRFYEKHGYVESPKYFVKNLHVRSEHA